jgi:hypothetical protein
MAAKKKALKMPACEVKTTHDDLAVALLWMACDGDEGASAKEMRSFFEYRLASQGERLRSGSKKRARLLHRLLIRLRLNR